MLLSIALELCPTSNLNTNIYRDISEYPIRKLMDAGITVTVNTDNMTVSNTNIKKELQILADAFNFDEKDIIFRKKQLAELRYKKMKKEHMESKEANSWNEFEENETQEELEDEER